MKIHILNRNEFKKFVSTSYADFNSLEADDERCFISIHGYDETMFFPSGKNFLNLFFDDLTDKELCYYPDCQLFDEGDAHLVIQFCNENKDKQELYIHCQAGVSRSGALGVCINDTWGDESFQVFMNRNRRIAPNSYVSMIFNKVLREQGE